MLLKLFQTIFKLRFTHFDMTLKDYPDNLQYLLFGDENGTYLSHIMTMRPDMHQVKIQGSEEIKQ